jgi:hypothetical protein
MESDWSRYWLKEIHDPLRYHRKQWEFVFVLQTLFENDCFGKVGLGLACGRELTPSYLISKGCMIYAGDKPLDKSELPSNVWKNSKQYTESSELLYYGHLVSRKDFVNRLKPMNIDMNDIPDSLYEKFDFCWSICAIEHLGSIENGINFLINSLNLLKTGGISVHTTEFNVYSNEHFETPNTCLFTQNDFMLLADKIHNGRLFPFDFNIGNGVFDNYVDIPPFPGQVLLRTDRLMPKCECPHLKVSCDKYVTTCAGIIMQKN